MRVLGLARLRIGAALVVVVSIALIGVGCEQMTEQEKIAEARSRYEATLTNFMVQQVPLVADESAEESAEGAAAAVEDAEATADDAAAEAEDQSAEEADAETVEEVPVRQDVLVDILVRHESDDPLDGITVDFYMSDGTNDIQNWKVWFDTTAVQANTPGVQFTHTFEDVDYQEGYGFYAEIRRPVPAAERGEYREFAGL